MDVVKDRLLDRLLGDVLRECTLLFIFDEHSSHGPISCLPHDIVYGMPETSILLLLNDVEYLSLFCAIFLVLSSGQAVVEVLASVVFAIPSVVVAPLDTHLQPKQYILDCEFEASLDATSPRGPL